MKSNINEDEILILLNDVIINEEELSDIELTDIEKRKIHKNVLNNINRKISIKKKWLVAASLVLVCITVLSSKPTIAATTVSAVKSFLFGDNKALEKAVKNDYIQQTNVSPVHSNGIEVQMTNILIDRTKIAISFNLKFDDTKLLENIQNLSMNLEIVDENNRILSPYRDRELSDKRIVKAITSGTDNFELVNKTDGIARYNIILNSQEGNIPKVDTLKVNIKSIDYFNKELSNSISGSWLFSTDVNDKFRKNISIKFTAENSGTNINIKSVETTATGTLIRFTTPKNVSIDVFKNIKLEDERGNIEGVAGVVNKQDGINTSTYSVTFPVTIFDNPKTLKLIVQDYNDKDIQIKLDRR